MGSSRDPRTRPFRTQTLTGPGDISDVPDVQGGGDPTFLLTDPSLFATAPAQMDVSGVQEAIRGGAEAREEGIREAVEQAQQARERASNQALLNLAGPQVFEAITGAGTDTGLEDRLRIQREAEKRAQQLEQEATQQIPQIQAEAETQAARLGAETEFQNQQAQREANLQEAEATRQFAQDYNSLVSTLEELRAERESGGGGLKPNQRLDIVETLYDRPELLDTQAGQTAASLAGIGPTQRQDLQSASTRAQAGTDIKSTAERLSQITETLNKGQIQFDQGQATTRGVTPESEEGSQPLREFVGETVVVDNQPGTLRFVGTNEGGQQQFIVDMPGEGESQSFTVGRDTPIGASPIDLPRRQRQIPSSDREDLTQEQQRLREQMRSQINNLMTAAAEDRQISPREAFEINQSLNLAREQQLLEPSFIDRAQRQVSQFLPGRRSSARQRTGGRGGIDQATIDAALNSYGQ